MHDALLSIVGNFLIQLNVSVAHGGEEIFFHQCFVIASGLVVQLSKNGTLPCTILVDPIVFQDHTGTYLISILVYFNSFENTGALTS